MAAAINATSTFTIQPVIFLIIKKQIIAATIHKM